MQIGETYLMLIHGEWKIVVYELRWKTHADNLKWRYGSPEKVYLLADVMDCAERHLTPLALDAACTCANRHIGEDYICVNCGGVA